MSAIEKEMGSSRTTEESRASRGPGERWNGTRIAAGVTTGVFAAMMAFAGVMFVLDVPWVAEGMRRLGYPAYFAPLLGAAKLAGAAVLVAPRVGRLREWAYAGFTFLLVAAILSHGLSGEGPRAAAPAALDLGLLFASYLLRRRAAGSGFAAPRVVPPPGVREVARGPAAAGSGEGASRIPALLRHSQWLGRAVLGAAAVLFLLVAVRQIGDPVGASAPHAIALGSTDAVTIERVMGGPFLALALALAACAASERRLLAGLRLLVSPVVAVTAVRVVGLVVDGAGPFTRQVLRPEIALVALSSLALLVERERRRRVVRATP